MLLTSELVTLLRSPFYDTAKQRPVTPLLIGTIAANCNGHALCHLGQQRHSLPPIGAAKQLALVASSESTPVLNASADVMAARPAKQVTAGRQHRHPHVKVVEPRIVLLEHTTRQEARGS